MAWHITYNSEKETNKGKTAVRYLPVYKSSGRVKKTPPVEQPLPQEIVEADEIIFIAPEPAVEDMVTPEEIITGASIKPKKRNKNKLV